MSTTTPTGEPVTGEPVTGEPVAVPETKKATSYVVLQKADASLTVLGTVEAPNDVKAIETIVAAQNISSGEFVAVPARSYRIRTVTVESVPHTRVS